MCDRTLVSVGPAHVIELPHLWVGSCGVQLCGRGSCNTSVYTRIWKKDFRGSRAPRIMSARDQLRVDQNKLIQIRH